MPESVYCGHCGRELPAEEWDTHEGVPFCSAECRTAAEKQDAGQQERRPERVLVSGRAPWGR